MAAAPAMFESCNANSGAATVRCDGVTVGGRAARMWRRAGVRRHDVRRRDGATVRRYDALPRCGALKNHRF